LTPAGEARVADNAGKPWSSESARTKARGIALHDLNAIDPATLIVTVIGDRDARAADVAARRRHRQPGLTRVGREVGS
jgi:hypothetical protein